MKFAMVDKKPDSTHSPVIQSDITILAVDDTSQIRDLLGAVLRRAGYTVLTASDASEMDVVLGRNSVDLIVLDLMMPGEDGLSVCQRISRAGGPPIIMLSAKGEDLDRIAGLELGAEDYMAKPFNPDELCARVRVVLRRRGMNRTPEQTSWTFFGWTLDKETRKLESPDGKVLALSSAEFALLRVFLDSPDRPLKRQEILERMKHVHDFTTVSALDTLVSRFRGKLKYAHPSASVGDELIQTVYGVGYIFRPVLKPTR